jgi:murein DD-endopeptidase MepM/ murein hydrolase activator NlpD
VPVPTAAPTAVPNPQPSEPLPTGVPNPQPSEPLPTGVPNPQPSQPLPTGVPNPQPSEPLPTAVPNPQPSQPLPTAVPNPQPSQPLPTAVPNPQPSEPLPTQPGPAGIVCPLNGPFTHIDDFNSPRVVGGIHRANDLIAATGTPVIAVASGMLEHKNSSVGGLSAHLRGDNGDYYFYTHLSAYENVGIGHVSAGTVIGYVGMTGNAPIPHLHFEIHRGGYGNYANPYPAVKQACGT